MKYAQEANRLLVADSGPLFCRGLCTLLGAEKSFKVVDTASEADEVLAKVRFFAPDVLVIDAELLRSDEPSLGFALRREMSNGSILVLTNDNSEENLAYAIAAGAKGYMLKNSTPAQLVEGIRRITFAKNDNLLPIPKIIPDLNALAAQNHSKVPTPVLTARESEVLRLLAEGKTVRAVADELSLSMKTVEAHKLNLMRKLGIHHRTALVAYAVQHGMAPASTAY
jgi:DNA-binding NarL/FixJ family response regulator